ncbi:serine/threonine-protein kinase [Neosynechococcus sphagnicola]|uniref:serine/threonine-protein kinase n=1 Tax=Neosynechococcus sphagnicola TaxID=1501145 RepID=UPI001EF9CFFF|nr:serine/threonine-protein kinase [Neosynechococcus sphagnicola]
MTSTLLNNRYRLISPLGKGGFGVTMLAEDTYMPSKRACVIKQLKPITNNPAIYQLVKERFQREAALLEELSSGTDQIPQLYAYFEESEKFYLVQELIDGQTLENTLLREGTLSEKFVIDILANVLKVLDYVHSKGIIHRDIKPANIMIRKRDTKTILIDFGAVKETMFQGEQKQIKIVGSPGFMAPEQAEGSPTYASDLYGLGMTAIYLMTGQPSDLLPRDPKTGQMLWQSDKLKISNTLALVLEKAIQSDWKARYQTAQEMLMGMGELHVDLLADQLRRYRRPSHNS